MTAISLAALDIDELAPVRKPRHAPLTNLNPDIPKPSSSQLTQATQTLARTGWVETLAPRLPGTRRARKGGRKATITLEAVLTGALLLAIMERPFIVRDIARLLEHGIDANTRKRFGIDKKTVVTERKVSRLFNLMIATMNPSVHANSNTWLFDADQVRTYLELDDETELDAWELAHFADRFLTEYEQRLDLFVRQGLKATHPEGVHHAGDYAMDATYIASWENERTARRRTTRIDDKGEAQRIPRHPEQLADPDARWWRKKSDDPRKQGDSGLGYSATTINWIEEDLGPNKRGADIPHVIEHLYVIGAKGSVWQQGTFAMTRMVAHHEHEDEAAGVEHRTRGDIVTDREYSRVTAWQRDMHDLGFTPHFLLAKEQRGLTHTLPSGVLVIDGIPYSPGIPERLRVTPTPGVFETRGTRAIAADFYNSRAPYRIRANGGRRQDDGSIKAYCAASNLAGHAIDCANKPASGTGRAGRIEIGTALPVIGATPLPAICARSSVTIPFEQIPFWQPHIPGTPEHQWSVNRRNTIEGSYSRIKDEATQSIRRGQIRLMGRAKMTFAMLVYAMAANLLEVQRWQHRQDNVTDISEAKPRQPRLHTRKRIAAKARREAWFAARQRELAQDIDGLLVDIKTGEILNKENDPPDLE